MGSIKEWLVQKLGLASNSSADAKCLAVEEMAAEFQVRELAFLTCVNLVANAVGKCKFLTYQGGQEVRGAEYYLWNYAPNVNQNSSEFLHDLIYRLFLNGEAIVISQKNSSGAENLYVADSYLKSNMYADRPVEYSGVTVGDTSFPGVFLENEVLSFRLAQKNIKPVLDRMYASYAKLIETAKDGYEWAGGKHFKVHVNQVASGASDFREKFEAMMTNDMKTFFSAKNAVLPEFDGYQYENIGGSADSGRTTRDIRALVDDVFDFTARALGIPTVLVLGDVAGTEDAMQRWLTTCIDPICDQIEEEITKKRYGYRRWKAGEYLRVDTSGILHFDLFGNAEKVEKLIGSGVYSVNDVRIAAGMAPLPDEWANEHFLTLNIGSMENQARPLEGGVENG